MEINNKSTKNGYTTAPQGFGSIYRTSPYQFMVTAPLVNTTQSVGNVTVVECQVTTIKTIKIPTQPK